MKTGMPHDEATIRVKASILNNYHAEKPFDLSACLRSWAREWTDGQYRFFLETSHDQFSTGGCSERGSLHEPMNPARSPCLVIKPHQLGDFEICAAPVRFPVAGNLNAPEQLCRPRLSFGAHAHLVASCVSPSTDYPSWPDGLRGQDHHRKY